jgi:hypothetical protein
VSVRVECACGWVTQGEENQVIEAMQVHTRLIHGREITRDEVLTKAKKDDKPTTSRRRQHGRGNSWTSSFGIVVCSSPAARGDGSGHRARLCDRGRARHADLCL